MVMYLDTGERMTGSVATNAREGSFRVRSVRTECAGLMEPASEVREGRYRIACADGAKGSGALSGIGTFTGEGTLRMEGGRYATFRYGNAVR